MRRFVDVRVKHEPFVEKIEDIYLKIRTTKNRTDYTVDYDDTIILDENGTEYVLTFCCIDYGGGGPTDCIDDYSFIFKVNQSQLEVLKLLTGRFNAGKESLKKIENILYLLDNEKDILEKMNISEDILITDTYGFLNEMPV